MKYPDQYLHVEECASGATWIVPLSARRKLDLKKLVKEWIKGHFGGEFVLDGELIPRMNGDFYARIMTDGHPPESVTCWRSGGFYVEGVE
jgi:hypothetical protein